MKSLHQSVVLGVILLLVLPAVVFTQSKRISREEYYQPFRDALKKSRTLPRRHVQEIKSIRNDKEYDEQWTYEYQPPDKVRYLHVAMVDGKTRRTEQINIGNIKYCRKDAGPWALAGSNCIGGGDGSGGPSNIISERFTREASAGRTLYTEYTTYKNTFSKTADTDGPSFWESKYWLDARGLITRYETRRGLVANRSTPRYEMVESYDYDPNVKIEVPLK